MNKKNSILALSLLSAMTISSTTSVLAYTNPVSLLQVVKSDLQADTGTNAMNEESDIKYLDTNIDPADGTQAKDKWGQYTGWTRPFKEGDNASLNGQYNDATWEKGKGVFSTKNNSLNPSSKAYFFRGYFNVNKASDVYGIHLNFDYKDAVIVYINGQQLTALNVPKEGYRTQEGAGSHKDNMGYGSEKTYTTQQNADLYFRDIKDMLNDGQNVISFEIHKSQANSDAYFAMKDLTINPEESKLPERTKLKAISLSVGANPTELNLNWFSTENGNGVLQYAKKADMKNNQFPEDKAKTIKASIKSAQADGYYANKATMSGLSENTEYVYRVGNSGTWSEVYTTKTKSNGAFSFLFAGDPQLGSSGDLSADKDGWKNTLNLVKTNPLFKDVHFIQNAGDHVEAGTNESQYDAYLSNYEGSLVYSTPFANAVGNHDSKGTAYNDHFNLPNVSQLGDSGEGNAQGDYYYVYNNSLMMVLNSNNLSTAEHQEFIENTIAKTKNNQDIKWKIVVFHHSIYSSASHASDNDILDRRTALAPMFKKVGIDLVLMGHDHVYTRSMFMDGAQPLKEESFEKDGKTAVRDITNPKGIPYITANSASGSKYYEFTDNISGDYIAVKNQEHIPNITKINVSSDQLKIATYRTNDLSVVDELTIHKTSTTPTTPTTPTAPKIDKSKLQNLYQQLKKLDQSHYTKDTYQVLQQALQNAQYILNKQDSTESDVAQAVTQLQTAQAQLKEKTDTQSVQTQNPVKTDDNTQIFTTVAAASIALVVGATVYIRTKKEH